MKKIFYKIMSIISLLILLFIVNGCSITRTIEIQKEETSPDGLYNAYVYTFTDGGATVAFRQAISIVNSDKNEINKILSEESPNVYLNNNSSNDEIDIEWEDDRTLKVKFNNEEKNLDYIYLKADIFINYNFFYNRIFQLVCKIDRMDHLRKVILLNNVPILAYLYLP